MGRETGRPDAGSVPDPRPDAGFQLVDLTAGEWHREVYELSRPGRVRTLEDISDLATSLARGVLSGHVDRQRVAEARHCLELAYSAIVAGRPTDARTNFNILQVLGGLPRARRVAVDAPFKKVPHELQAISTKAMEAEVDVEVLERSGGNE